MADKVQAQYEQLDQIVSQLNQQAQAVEDVNNKIKGPYEELVPDGWKGKGADQFKQEMDQRIFPMLGKMKDALTSASSATKQMAETFKQAEEEGNQLIISIQIQF
jgi:WXG100 family type VII secretion target